MLGKSDKTFRGYVRKNGSVGIRNYLLMLPSVFCANGPMDRLAKMVSEKYPATENFDGVLALHQEYGCSQAEDDLRLTAETMASFMTNGNFGGVLVISLGCEVNDLVNLKQYMGEGFDPDRIRFLVDEHILELTDGQYPVLRCGERAEDVAYSDGPLMMKAVREERPAADRRRAEDSPLTERQQALFQRLREERAHLARLRGVPAFVIFSDKTLREMAISRPRTTTELRAVSGVGSAKAERYGRDFLTVIQDFPS